MTRSVIPVYHLTAGDYGHKISGTLTEDVDGVARPLLVDGILALTLTLWRADGSAAIEDAPCEIVQGGSRGATPADDVPTMWQHEWQQAETAFAGIDGAYEVASMQLHAVYADGRRAIPSGRATVWLYA